jgi:hypothetical protein
MEVFMKSDQIGLQKKLVSAPMKSFEILRYEIASNCGIGRCGQNNHDGVVKA